MCGKQDVGTEWKHVEHYKEEGITKTWYCCSMYHSMDWDHYNQNGYTKGTPVITQYNPAKALKHLGNF